MSNKEKDFSDHLVEKTLSYILAAFGLVAGLAWNEAITSLINYIFPTSSNSILAKFVYAILVTVLVVGVSLYFMKILKKKNE